MSTPTLIANVVSSIAAAVAAAAAWYAIRQARSLARELKEDERLDRVASTLARLALVSIVGSPGSERPYYDRIPLLHQLRADLSALGRGGSLNAVEKVANMEWNTGDFEAPINAALVELGRYREAR